MRTQVCIVGGGPSGLLLAQLLHLEGIDSVVLAGAVYDRAALDGLRDGVKNAAGHWSMWPKFAWQILNSPIMRKQFGD